MSISKLDTNRDTFQRGHVKCQLIWTDMFINRDGLKVVLKFLENISRFNTENIEKTFLLIIFHVPRDETVR